MSSDAFLQSVEIAGLPIGQRPVGGWVVRMVVGQMEVAGGPKVMLAGCGAEHEALLRELTIQHPDVKPKLLAAGFGLLGGAWRASGEDRGRR